MSEHLKIKKHLQNYERDSYIGNGEDIRKKFGITPEIEINCELGTSPFGQSITIKEAIQNFNFESSVHYFDPFHQEIKKVIVRRFKDASLDLDNIFFGHGSFNLAERIIHKLVRPTRMLGYGPQFNEIPTEMVCAGGEYNPTPMNPDDFLFPEVEIREELLRGDYSILYIDNPNNPTGQLIPLQTLEKIISTAEETGTMALIDEAYGDFVNNSNSAFNIVKNHQNLMVIRSLSKGMGLGSFRFGYAAFSDEIVPVYKQIDVPFEPSLISSVAGKAALEDPDFIRSVRTDARKAKSVLTDGLSKLGLKILPTHPNVSIFVAHKPEINLYETFASQGIITEPGEAYKRVYSQFDNSFVRIRIPFGKEGKTPYEMSHGIIEKMKEAL